MRSFHRFSSLALLRLGLACGCAFDVSLREYLNAKFWLPFSKGAWHFEKKSVRRVDVAFAGMSSREGDSPLAHLRAAYQAMIPADLTPDAGPLIPPPGRPAVRDALAKALADGSMTARDREETELLGAKIDMRFGEGEVKDEELLRGAAKKLDVFLRAARTPEFRSEARGWLAHVYFLLGNQTAAGKIYLDELNRNGSNLSRETLLNSLNLTYGNDGGQELEDHLGEYFDTPEHAAFAVQMVTNPASSSDARRRNEAKIYANIRRLLAEHSKLLESSDGGGGLAVLGMRVALRRGDLPAAIRVADMVPDGAAVRNDPDFQWMLASARFLSHEFAAAEEPLLQLFGSARASDTQRAAAAYGLCGVYMKTGNFVERIRFALWLQTGYAKRSAVLSYPASIRDGSIYWAVSGWDLATLLDQEAPDEALEEFLKQFGSVTDARLVRYSLAVRRAREERYEEAADSYESIHAMWRVPRMRQIARLYAETKGTDEAKLREAQYRYAEFLSIHSDRVYFNDQLWNGQQRYALTAEHLSGLTGEERRTLVDGERKLKDDQEELWRAYLILREVVDEEGKTGLGRKSAQLAVRCLRRISDRFGREGEIRKADLELSKWLKG